MQVQHLCDQVMSLLLLRSVLPLCVQEDEVMDVQDGKEKITPLRNKIFSMCLLMVLESQFQLGWHIHVLKKQKQNLYLFASKSPIFASFIFGLSLYQKGAMAFHWDPVRVFELQLLRRTM